MCKKEEKEAKIVIFGIEQRQIKSNEHEIVIKVEFDREITTNEAEEVIWKAIQKYQEDNE